jgi:hypothetical protein
MKRVSSVQGGESRVLNLADELQARRLELSTLQEHVQNAQALNTHLKAHLTAQEQPATEATPA